MRKKAGNKGFTLIELLLVMVITVMILTMLLISFTVVNNANATKAARRLETVIRTARTQSMAKGPDAGKLTLTVEHGNLYAQIGDPATADKEVICNSGVTVKGLLCGTQTEYLNRNGNDFTSALVVFNQSGTVRINGPDGTKTTLNKFLLNRGSRSFEVKIYNETGAIESNMY